MTESDTIRQDTIREVVEFILRRHPSRSEVASAIQVEFRLSTPPAENTMNDKFTVEQLTRAVLRGYFDDTTGFNRPSPAFNRACKNLRELFGRDLG